MVHVGTRTCLRPGWRIFLATASAKAQPYIQHRGAPPGFLKVLDGKTLGLADFVGTQGNLMDNPKAHLFLIDYTQRQRIKIWGEARIVEDKTELMARLTQATGHAPNS
jgi:predicted pyridoxine 5'-phosphate oxidase superfamily flavin-nucleotide-binding protein